MSFSLFTSNNTPVILAPMAGITDWPFRKMVAEFGADLMFSEMIATQEFTTGRALVKKKLDIGALSVPQAVQIAGVDPEIMAETARFAADNGAVLIDINMGCPAKKVTKGATGGAAILRDEALAVKIVRHVRAAVDIPLSVKMRLGWNEVSADTLAPKFEAEGVNQLTVHGRTRMQFYKGKADWRAVRRFTDAVSIPIIVNGDIVDFHSARDAMTQSKAQAVMIGRGAQGAPWRIAKLQAAIESRSFQMPRLEEVKEIIATHYEEILKFYGIDLGVRIARKHLGWYCDTLGLKKAERMNFLTLDAPQDVFRKIATIDVTHSQEAA